MQAGAMKRIMSSDDDPRVMIAKAMRDALSGRESGSAKVEHLFADWRRLSHIEKSALLQLRNWAQDRQLREQYEGHAAWSEQRLTNLLGQLAV